MSTDNVQVQVGLRLHMLIQHSAEENNER